MQHAILITAYKNDKQLYDIINYNSEKVKAFFIDENK